MHRFNPYSDEYQTDPYAVFRYYLQHDPVHWGEAPDPSVDGSWYVFGYEQAAAALKDPRLGHDRGIPVTVSYFGKFLNACDPPLHTRLRQAVSHAFTQKVIEGLRSFTEILAERLLADKPADFDLIADFAGPLPMHVIARLLGVPVDYPKLRRLSQPMARLAEEATPEVFMGAMQATQELVPMIKAADSELVRNLKQSDLTEEERIATCMLLLVAGHETTVNLIGNGMLALLQHPEQWARLRHEPQLVSSAIEELLRWDPPGRIAVRWALDDLEIDGRQIRKGQRVAVVIAAANHDPNHFAKPEKLDVARREGRHLSFGLGIHYCLVASLARMEAEVAFRALLQHEWQLGDYEWQRRVSMRGLERLSLRTAPRARC